MPEIFFEVRDEALLEDSRLDRYEEFASWLVGTKAIKLPDEEIIVDVCDGEFLPARPYRVPSNSAVGCFAIRLPKGNPRFWLIALALGNKDASAWDQEDRLVSLAHELIHLSEFWQEFGSTPGIVSEKDGGVMKLNEVMRRPEKDEVEARAGFLTRRFLGYE
jgi:hypothetical protein